MAKVIPNVTKARIKPSGDLPNVRHITAVDNITMATLTKLLRISIVANNLLGLSSIRAIFLFDEFLLCLHFIKSSLDREKNATSDPDTKAEANRSNISITPFKGKYQKGSLMISASKYGLGGSSNPASKNLWFGLTSY